MYKSINEFIENNKYISKNGNVVEISSITNEPNWKKISFVINDSIRDMQSWDNFLNFMNGGSFSILNF